MSRVRISSSAPSSRRSRRVRTRHVRSRGRRARHSAQRRCREFESRHPLHAHARWILRLVQSRRVATVLAVAVSDARRLRVGAGPRSRRNRPPRAVPRRAPEGGTPDQPAPIEATRSLMEWVPAPGAVANTVTTNGTWFLTVEASGDAYRLDGPDQAFGTGAGRHPDHQRAARHRLGGRRPAGRGPEEAGHRRGHRPRQGRAVHDRQGLRRTDHLRRHLGPRRRHARARDARPGRRLLRGHQWTSRPARPRSRWCARGQARLQRRPRHATPAPRCSASTTRSRRAAPSAPWRTSSSTPSPASPSARPGRAPCSATTRRSGR